MSKILRMPSLAMIDGFKGKLDFYYCRGIPCVRSWPKRRATPATPAELRSQQTFANAARLYSQLDTTLIRYLQDNAASTSLTSKDIFFRAYLSGLPTEVYQGH